MIIVRSKILKAFVRNKVRALLAALALTVAMVSAQAQQWNDCTPSNMSPDVRIVSCTGLLDAGRLSASERAIAYTNRAIALQDKGELDRAIADYSEAIKIDPYGKHKPSRGTLRIGDKSKNVRREGERQSTTAQAYADRGTVWSAKRDYDRAIADYDQAIKIDPKFATAYDSRGNAWHRKGDYDRAIADYGEALRIEPRYARVYGDRGMAYSQKGDYDRAILDFDHMLKLNPTAAYVYDSRGNAWYRKGDYDRAIADYNEAIKLEPKYALAYYNRGIAWEKKSQLSRALADFQSFSSLAPSDPNGPIAIARVEKAQSASNESRQQATPTSPSNTAPAAPPIAAHDDKSQHDKAKASTDLNLSGTDNGRPLAFSSWKKECQVKEGKTICMVKSIATQGSASLGQVIFLEPSADHALLLVELVTRKDNWLNIDESKNIIVWFDHTHKFDAAVKCFGDSCEASIDLDDHSLAEFLSAQNLTIVPKLKGNRVAALTFPLNTFSSARASPQ